ncbi:hypothetical protein ACIOWI_32975 [Streptomyces sp. NPDC087659]|uniref:hypothetical protein n=1 Tax=Streptomyces sp. NPDC087659 TaxID=3365801 RepID=UPI00381AF220
MFRPATLTVRYTPPGAPDDDAFHLELHAAPGARLALQLGCASSPTPHYRGLVINRIARPFSGMWSAPSAAVPT